MGVVRAAGISSKCSFSPPALWTPATKSHKPRTHGKTRNPHEHPFITAELDYKHLGCNQSRCRQAHAHTFIRTPLALQLPREQYYTSEKGASFPITLCERWLLCVTVCMWVCVCAGLLKVLVKPLEIELMESIKTGLSAGSITSPSLQAGQRICPPLQHLPKSLLLLPPPPLPIPFSFFLSSSSFPNLFANCATFNLL